MSGRSLPSLPSSTSGISWLPKDLKNHFRIEEAIGRTVISLASHPFDYVKILIQIGYEPIPAEPVVTIFGRKRFQYPSVISYLGHVRRKDGIIGCYRGIGFKLAYTLVHGFAYANLTEWAKSTIANPKVRIVESSDAEEAEVAEEEEAIDTRSMIHPDKLKELLDTLMRETACKFLALSIAYPFHVMTVRCCSQFIGGETVYSSLKGAVGDIYKNSGLGGFWIGFMPKFVGDCLILWVTHGLIYVTKEILRDMDKKPTDQKSAAISYLSASINFVVTSACYPFQLVSTVMICNGLPAASLESSALSGRDPYSDWIDAWKHLSSTGDLKRGSSMFWRYKPIQKRNYVGVRYGN